MLVLLKLYWRCTGFVLIRLIEIRYKLLLSIWKLDLVSMLWLLLWMCVHCHALFLLLTRCWSKGARYLFLKELLECYHFVERKLHLIRIFIKFKFLFFVVLQSKNWRAVLFSFRKLMLSFKLQIKYLILYSIENFIKNISRCKHYIQNLKRAPHKNRPKWNKYSLNSI